MMRGYQPVPARPDYFGKDAQGAIRRTRFLVKFVSGAGGPVLARLLFALGSFAATMDRPPQLVPIVQVD